MKKLPFQLPDFTRIIWATAHARKVWEPKVSAFTAAWSEVERLSVADGVRPSALVFVGPDELPAYTLWAAKHGLVALPLARSGVGKSYASTHVPLSEGAAWHYRVALTRPELAEEWQEAWENSRDKVIGRLLGFPDCCQEFFQRTWVDDSRVDTTWAMVQDGDGDMTVRLRPLAAECNILLRWLGVRLVPHLPCSFFCEPTCAMGEALVACGERNGFAEQMKDAKEMLQWPVEWSALHGIAEIRTPVVKMVTRTDATAEKLVVQCEGAVYPAEGVNGVQFPYEPNKAPVILTRSKSFAASVEDRALWEENGFTSKAAMESAHDGVMARLAPLVQPGSRVLDLGCGNGVLLDRLEQADIYGVEQDSARMLSALFRHPRGHWYTGSIFAADAEWRREKFDVALLMVGRLTECSEAERADLLQWLSEHTENVVLYAYGDWLGKFPKLVRDYFPHTRLQTQTDAVTVAIADRINSFPDLSPQALYS